MAAHCGQVLPEVAYRQWTLSAPFALRWRLLRSPALLAKVERRLVHAVWRWQRRAARRLRPGIGLQGGAVAFTQYFGSSLQLTPHLHVLLPDGLWDAEGGFVGVTPPTARDVAAVLRRVLRQLKKDFADLEERWPEDALEALWAQLLQQRLPLTDAPLELEPDGRRVARLEGFNLHADTWVHAHDRAGLERLCRYGSRGPLALERLGVGDDGRYQYRTRKGQLLRFTAEELVARLVALIPPPRTHLTRFHGVLAPNARLRPRVIRPPPAAPAAPPAHAGTRPPTRSAHPAKQRTDRPPRLDWATLQRRTFDEDVWRCPCGGRRRVLAVVTHRRAAEELLARLGRLPPPAPPPRAHSPPQLQLAL